MSARSVCSGTVLAIPLRARDLDAVQAARAHDLDALSTEPHRVLHRTLHCAAKHDPLFELLRDRVRDELRVDSGLRISSMFKPDLGAHHLAQARAQRLDVLAFLADDDAGRALWMVMRAFSPGARS
jgi:hypothetical protein